MPPQDSPNATQICTIPSNEPDPIANIFEKLSPKFEERLLQMADRHANKELNEGVRNISIYKTTVDCEALSEAVAFETSTQHSLLIGLTESELGKWVQGYKKDPTFGKVLEEMSNNTVKTNLHSKIFKGENGLLYIEDWHGNNKLCVPENLRASIMTEIHETPSEAAHTRYHQTYNQMASRYYWPHMSRDIKKFIQTCNICQKVKPQ